MGTSKPNNGPTGISSPIPPWTNDNRDESGNDNNQNNQQKPQEDLKPWGDVKRSYSNFIRNPNKGSFRQFTGSYRKANGGNKTISKSAIGGRKAAGKLVHFLGVVSKSGFEEACEEFQLGNLEGVPPEEAINRLCGLFEDIDGTDEGSAAKAAVVETINYLYENYSDNPDAINSMAVEQISDYLNLYISNYIFERLSIEVSKALENDKFTKEQVITANDTLKDFITAEVNLNFSEKDFSSLNIKQQNEIVDEIFTLAYSMI